MSFEFARTKLAPGDQAKVPTPGYLPLLADEVPLAIKAGKRVYAYLEESSEIVRIQSDYDLERFSNRVTFGWTFAKLGDLYPPIIRA